MLIDKCLFINNVFFSRSLTTRNLYYDYYDPSMVTHKKDPESKYYGQDANGNTARYSIQGKYLTIINNGQLLCLIKNFKSRECKEF